VADAQNVYFVDGEGTKSVPLEGGPVRTLTDRRPYSIMVSGQTLYLADNGPGGGISSVPIDGGPVTVLADEPNGAIHPVICGDSLCWVGGPAMDASLKRRTPDGSIRVVVSGLRQPHAVVFDGTSFFVSGAGGGLFLYRIPASGGDAEVIHGSGGLSSLALDDECLYWSAAAGIFTWARSAANAAPGLQ
jgi:hypothetical protein